MLIQEIIRKKRDGGTLSSAEIGALIEAVTRDEAAAPQAAAFAMSVFFRGLSDAETVALTTAMRDSGPVLAWPSRNSRGPSSTSIRRGASATTSRLYSPPCSPRSAPTCR